MRNQMLLKIKELYENILYFHFQNSDIRNSVKHCKSMGFKVKKKKKKIIVLIIYFFNEMASLKYMS